MLTENAKERKAIPVCTGVLDYFPLAIVEVAKTSKAGNDQHNPGQPLHWDKEKSTDHADCIIRHLIDRGTIDGDGIRHSAKVAWRALALLQTEMENDGQWVERPITQDDILNNPFPEFPIERIEKFVPITPYFKEQLNV